MTQAGPVRRGGAAIERATKLILGIVAAAVYLTALGWIVRHQGESYRRDLAQRRAAEPKEIVPPPDPFGEPEPSVVRPEVAGHNPATALMSGPIPAHQSQRKFIAGESRPTPADLRPGAPLTNAPIDPRPANLRGLAPEALVRIGDELNKAVMSAHAAVDDQEKMKRIELLARPLCEGQSIGADAPRFHVIDSDQVNAFSHVGGHIYVSRGVFALAQVDSELEFVIAHELAHLALGHPAARLEQIAQGPGARLGLLPSLDFLIACGYSDDQEFQADAWAYQALRHAGRSHREAVAFLRRYALYTDGQGLTLHPHPPKTGPGESPQDLDNHYPAHPPARERLARLEVARSAAK